MKECFQPDLNTGEMPAVTIFGSWAVDGVAGISDWPDSRSPVECGFMM
jgi:hypothetical protein